MSPQDLQHCIEECTACHAACIATIQHCLGIGGRHAARDHIRLMADCAQICRTSADFMIRGSDLHPLTCGVCAEVCQRCGDDCEQMAGGTDAEMRRCADQCHRCAESCRQMAHAHA
ncbi:MAG TPA: four-helix bundle copper-binding protein [Tepidisphaeraceae bacterium]